VAALLEGKEVMAHPGRRGAWPVAALVAVDELGERVVQRDAPELEPCPPNPPLAIPPAPLLELEVVPGPAPLDAWLEVAAARTRTCLDMQDEWFES